MRKKTVNKSFIKNLFDGTILTKLIAGEWKFIMFLGLLAIIYITNRYNAEKTYINTAVIQEELKELKAESTLLSTQLMEISKESEIEKTAEKKGLKLYLPERPPKEIKIIADK